MIEVTMFLPDDCGFLSVTAISGEMIFGPTTIATQNYGIKNKKLVDGTRKFDMIDFTNESKDEK